MKLHGLVLVTLALLVAGCEQPPAPVPVQVAPVAMTGKPVPAFLVSDSAVAPATVPPSLPPSAPGAATPPAPVASKAPVAGVDAGTPPPAPPVGDVDFVEEAQPQQPVQRPTQRPVRKPFADPAPTPATNLWSADLPTPDYTGGLLYRLPVCKFCDDAETALEQAGWPVDRDGKLPSAPFREVMLRSEDALRQRGLEVTPTFVFFIKGQVQKMIFRGFRGEDDLATIIAMCPRPQRSTDAYRNAPPNLMYDVPRTEYVMPGAPMMVGSPNCSAPQLTMTSSNCGAPRVPMTSSNCGAPPAMAAPNCSAPARAFAAPNCGAPQLSAAQPMSYEVIDASTYGPRYTMPVTNTIPTYDVYGATVYAPRRVGASLNLFGLPVISVGGGG